MCNICRQTPCNVRCPNYEDEPIMYCSCGNPIYLGEDYYEICGVIYCEDCISDSRRTAEQYDKEDYYAEF